MIFGNGWAGDILLRHAEPDDAGQLTALYRELLPDNPGIEVLPECLAAIAGEANSLLLVAECAGQLVGTAMLNLCLDAMFRAQPFGVLENLVVTRKTRGQGVGGALMRALEDVALQHDCSKLMVLSAISRPDAHRFFETDGFDGNAKRGFVKYRRNFRPGRRHR